MDDTSRSIAQARRQVDRAFADWYSQRRDLNEFIQQFQNEEWHAEVKELSETYETNHFNQAKKRKSLE